MINLFTYLSFTNISIGQLYQYFIIALLSIIVLFSTYFSLKKLPSSIQIKENFYLLFIGFITIILNVGLFFVFLYLTKKSFFTTFLWFPVFSFILHIVDLIGQSILASTILTNRLSHRNIIKIIYSIFISFFFIMIVSIAFFLLPVTSKIVYKYLFQSNYIIFICDIIYISLTLTFFFVSKFRANGFLKYAVLSLFTAYSYHAVTIIYPSTIKYLIIYNLLNIFGYLLFEIFIFNEIIKELSATSISMEALNIELESKIKDRTQELYNSNKELFHTNYMLHQEKEKLNAIIENLEEGIIVSNISHTLLMINTSTRNLLCLDKNVVGNPISEIIPDTQYIQDLSQVILKKVRMISKEIKITNAKKEKIHVHLRSSLSTDSKGNIIGVITLLRNITKEIEIEELKSGFLKTMSHELKTPLTNIIGFSETLFGERRGKLNENQKSYVDIILNESLHLNKLINDLLEFSLITSNKISLTIEEVSLKAIINEIIDSYRPQASVKNIEISYDDAFSLPTIQADKEKLYKAFANIINNALNNTENGFIRVTFSTDRNKIITKTQDTGVGIRPTDLEKIFDKFSQIDSGTKGAYKGGLGLGLSIAKDLIELHDGRIWVESVFGEGSSFFVELPIIHG